MKVPQWLNTSSLYNQRQSIERPLSFPAVRIHSCSEVGNRAGWFLLAQPCTLLSSILLFYIFQNCPFMHRSPYYSKFSLEVSACICSCHTGMHLFSRKMVIPKDADMFLSSPVQLSPRVNSSQIPWLQGWSGPTLNCVFSSFLVSPWESW